MGKNDLAEWSALIDRMGEESAKKTALAREVCAIADAEFPMNDKMVKIHDLIMLNNSLTSRGFVGTGITPDQVEEYRHAIVDTRRQIKDMLK